MADWTGQAERCPCCGEFSLREKLLDLRGTRGLGYPGRNFAIEPYCENRCDPRRIAQGVAMREQRQQDREWLVNSVQWLLRTVEGMRSGRR